MSLKNNKVVYVYRDEFLRPFYVGMGSMRRAYEAKITDSRTPEFCEAIRKYEHATNMPCYPEIVSTHLTRELALELEAFIISEIGLDMLCNRNRGVNDAKRQPSTRVYRHGGERRKKTPRLRSEQLRKARPRQERKHPYKDKIIYK